MSLKKEKTLGEKIMSFFVLLLMSIFFIDCIIFLLIPAIMSNQQNKLIGLYTVISFILALIPLANLLIHKKHSDISEEDKQQRKSWIWIFFLAASVLPAIFSGLFFTNVIFYMIAEKWLKDDFISVQIITNILNFYLLYMLIKIIKNNNPHHQKNDEAVKKY